MAKVRYKLLSVPALDVNQRRLLHQLFLRYYENTDFESFCADLGEKTHVLSFWAGRELVGFSTIRKLNGLGDLKGLFLFSGDTVFDDRFWSQRYLQKAFVLYALQTRLSARGLPVYWMLISKGYKTYLMMKKNFPYSFPDREKAIPPEIQTIMDGFYRWKFGRAYDASKGLIAFPEPRQRVRVEASQSGIQTDEDAGYFFKKNPTYHEGTELACLAQIRLRDLIWLLPKYLLRQRYLALRGLRFGTKDEKGYYKRQEES